MAGSDESWRQPKTVQELAAEVQEPPKQYVLKEHVFSAEQQAVSEMPEPIPIIDLGRLPIDADEADKFRDALQTWGLVLVTNHGMEGPLMDAMKATRDFFHQPLEEKKEYSNLKDGKEYSNLKEGYGNDEVVAPDQILDWSDMLQLMVEPEGMRNFEVWPTHPESFRDVMLEYFEGSRRIKDQMLVAIAKLLELDEDYFATQIALSRFNYYPPCPRPDLVMGSKPHSDGGLITILAIDDNVGGLQVERDGNWYNVPPKPCTLLVILGDCMEIISNGIFRSPMHRVVTNSGKERISLAVFYGMDYDKLIGPAPGLLDEKRPAKYRAIKFTDYQAAAVEIHRNKNLQGNRVIDTVKIQVN